VEAIVLLLTVYVLEALELVLAQQACLALEVLLLVLEQTVDATLTTV